MTAKMWHFLSSKEADHHASIGSREGEAPSKTRSTIVFYRRRRRRSQEEEKEEEKKIEDIVRTKFEGDAHRALFHVIGKKRNFCHDDDDDEEERRGE